MNIDSNNILNVNYKVLCARADHQVFKVVDGKLTIVESPIDKIIYFLFRSTIQSQVRQAISDVVRNYQPKENLETFYFEKLNRLSTAVFDRSEITPTEVESLTKISFREETDSRMKELRLAEKLGVGCTPISEGCSGAYFINNIHGKKLFVFKPDDESSLSGNSPKLRSKIVYFFRKLFESSILTNNCKQEESSLSEVRASILDNQLGLNIVPKTITTNFNSKHFVGNEKNKKGSLQTFVTATMAKDADTSKVKAEEFKKLVILDFLIGNEDRHNGNWMVDENNKIHAIDNGMSFPCAHLKKGLFNAKHIYEWRHHPLAQTQFEASDVAKLENINSAELNLDTQQLEMMELRISVLKKVMEKGKTMAFLGEIQTEQHYEAALSA